MLFDSLLAADTPAVSPRISSVLFALSRVEMAQFFPAGLQVDGLPAKVLLCPEGGDSFQKMVTEFAPEVLVTSWSTPAIPWDIFSRDLPAPKYICHTTGSVKALVPRQFLEEGGWVTNWGNLAAQTVAEHALLLVLAGLRRLPEWGNAISGKSRWQPSAFVTKTLYGKSVGIHGFGNVAQALVKLLKPFNVSLSAWSPGVPSELFYQHGVSRCNSFEELLGQSDVFVECEALTSETRGMLTRQLLQKLPVGALFVNVGRGAVVDEHALAELANKKHLFVALDVFSQDPIAVDSPLHLVPGAILSPHVAGPTSDQFPLCGERVLRNLSAYFSGKPLEARVTPEIYDRST